MGRPRLRWLEDAGKDLLVIKFPRWRQKADDREKLASVIKDATTLKRAVAQKST